MVFGSKIVGATYDILRGVNASVCGGVEGADQTGSNIMRFKRIK